MSTGGANGGTATAPPPHPEPKATKPTAQAQTPTKPKAKNSLDYSRFDNIVSDDSDDEAPPKPKPQEARAKPETRPGFMDEDSDDDGGPSTGKMPALEAVPGMEREAEAALAGRADERVHPPPRSSDAAPPAPSQPTPYEALTGTKHPFGGARATTRTRTTTDRPAPSVPNCLVTPALTINLARRPDRWEAMAAHARGFGLHLERVDAVDGRALVPEKLASFPMCSPPEAGTVLSHVRALRQVARRGRENGDTTALLLEDDARFSKDAFLVLAHALKEVPNDWDLLYLGANHLQPPDAVPGCDYVQICTAALAMHAYVVQCASADEVADYLETSPRACDVEMVRLQGTGALRVYCTDPPVATQAAGKSDIQGIDVGPELARMRFLGVDYDYEKEDAALTAADRKLEEEMASMDANVETAQARMPGSRTFQGMGRERITVNEVEISSMHAELEGAARRARHFHEKYLLEQKKAEAARRRVKELEAGGTRMSGDTQMAKTSDAEARAAAADARIRELEVEMRKRLLAAEARGDREARLRHRAEQLREHEDKLMSDWVPRAIMRPFLRLLWPLRIPGSAVEL